jgi:hypothetical protein
VWLTEHGVSVTTPALQRYLRTAQPTATGRDKSRTRRPRSSDPGDTNTATPVPPQPSTRVQSAAAPPPASRSATIAVQGGAEPSSRPQPPPRSGFAVRPDAKDI